MHDHAKWYNEKKNADLGAPGAVSPLKSIAEGSDRACCFDLKKGTRDPAYVGGASRGLGGIRTMA